jgi:hypothetical protein
MHGGLSPGAPKGKANGRYRDGYWTAEAIQERKRVRDVARTYAATKRAEIDSSHLPPVASIPSGAPRVRVRLQRVNCNLAKPYPPDGQGKAWWKRLKMALGTTSSDFVNATLVQIQNASRLPGGGIEEMSVNAALALIESAEPRNEVEAALIIQMACTHAVAMALLSSLGGATGGSRNIDMRAGAAGRLLKAFATQVETLRRLQKGGSQVVRVEHVHIHEGAQALIGNVKKT